MVFMEVFAADTLIDAVWNGYRKIQMEIHPLLWTLISFKLDVEKSLFSTGIRYVGVACAVNMGILEEIVRLNTQKDADFSPLKKGERLKKTLQSMMKGIFVLKIAPFHYVRGAAHAKVASINEDSSNLAKRPKTKNDWESFFFLFWIFFFLRILRIHRRYSISRPQATMHLKMRDPRYQIY